MADSVVDSQYDPSRERVYALTDETRHRFIGRAFCLVCALYTVCSVALPGSVLAGDEGMALRFYQGATAYIVNPDGVAMEIAVDVRQWHLLENGERELLIKVYDPDGRVLVRKLVENDGVIGTSLIPEAGGWDHEMWYYTLIYGRGSQPMVRWSSLTDPLRLAALPKRSFVFPVPAGKKGVYRVLMAGSRDHVATLRVTPGLKMGLAGHPLWLHGHHDLFAHSFVYVPKGTVGIDIGVAEFDQPATRNFKITAPDGAVLWDGPARGGFQNKAIKLDPAGKYDDQVLSVDVSAGAGDYMLHLQFPRTDVKIYRGIGGVPAIFCPDAQTAAAIQGGAIYHEGLVFWHGFQVRYHDWLKAHVMPEDLIVRDEKGNELKPAKSKPIAGSTPVMEYKGLASLPDFITLNGPHEAPPLCDQFMHNYAAHKNRNVLNIALTDLEKGLRTLTVGDTPTVPGWNGNLGYLFGTYSWHYWRPAWRVLQQSDAPQEIKEIVKEAIILGGDRIAMAAGIERTNGNALAHIPMALRYAAEGTQDPFLTRLADMYIDRFAHEGWGRGVGISKSGDCQEHFAHDMHYGSYILDSYRAVINDLHDPRFAAIVDRAAELYSYLACRDAAAYPWDSRTNHQPTGGGRDWKGDPGPDFTVNVNHGDEWFAVRRAGYYVLTFHGRLCPEWLDNYFNSRLGYGGGMICQLTIPGRGTVLAGTLNGFYGEKMQREAWGRFHIHSIVGTMADSQPLVAADSEHLDARLDGATVTSSGEVRDRPIHVARKYTFNADNIAVSAQLSDTDFRAALWNQGPSSRIAEAYEMIPFVSAVNPRKKQLATTVGAIDAQGKPVELGRELVTTSAIVIDRGGYGVRIELDRPRAVKRGEKDTLLIQLTDQAVKADAIGVQYAIRPFGAAIAAAVLEGSGKDVTK